MLLAKVLISKDFLAIIWPTIASSLYLGIVGIPLKNAANLID